MNYNDCVSAIITELWAHADTWEKHFNCVAQLRSFSHVLGRCYWWHEDLGVLFRLYKPRDIVIITEHLSQFYVGQNDRREKVMNAVSAHIGREVRQAPLLSVHDVKRELQKEFLQFMSGAGFTVVFVSNTMEPEEESTEEEHPPAEPEDYKGDVCEGDE